MVSKLDRLVMLPRQDECSRIPKSLRCPDHCLQARLTNQLHLEQGQAIVKSGQQGMEDEDEKFMSCIIHWKVKK